MKRGSCAQCGHPITADELALCQRLRGQQIGSFFCIPCLAERLGVEEARLRSFMQRLKDAGCSYFKRIAEE